MVNDVQADVADYVAADMADDSERWHGQWHVADDMDAHIAADMDVISSRLICEIGP